MITRLNVRNFKGCSESFEFDKINNIFGKNGSGKSTILEAIKIALTGYTENGKLASKTYQLSSDKVMEISIESSDGQTLSRTFEKSGSGAKQTITLNGVSVKESELKLPDSLNFSVESIHLSEFINMSGDKRTEYILSGLPAEIVNINPGDIDEKMNFFNGTRSISDLTELLKAKKSETEKEIKLCIANIQKLSGEIGELPSGTLQEWEEKKKVARIKLDEIISQIATNEGNSALFLQNKKSEEKQRQIIKQAQEKISSVREEIEVLKKSIQKVDSLPDNNISEREISLIESELNKKILFLATIEEKNKSLKNKMEQLKNGICPICGNEGKSISSLIDQIDIDIYNSEDHIKDVTLLIEKERSDLNDLKIALKDRKAIESLNEVKRNKNNQIELTIKVKLDAIDSYSRSLEQAVNDLEELEKMEKPSCVSNELLNGQKVGLQANIKESESAINKFVAAQALRNKKSDSEKERMKLESLLDTIKSAIESVKKIRDARIQSFENEIKKPFDTIIESAFSCPALLKLSKGDKPCFEFGVIKNGYYIYFDTLSGGEKTVMLAALAACLQKIKNGKIGLGLFELAEADSDTAMAFVKAVSNIGFEQIFIASCHGQEISGLNNIRREK